MLVIRLKDEYGRVIEVPKESCYAPDEEGNILAAIGGFSYFTGKRTNDKVTHKPNNHPDLRIRGDLECIDGPDYSEL